MLFYISKMPQCLKPQSKEQRMITGWFILNNDHKNTDKCKRNGISFLVQILQFAKNIFEYIFKPQSIILIFRFLFLSHFYVKDMANGIISSILIFEANRYSYEGVFLKSYNLEQWFSPCDLQTPGRL